MQSENADNAHQKPAQQKPTKGELTEAVRANDIKAVEELLLRDADINEENKLGWNMLRLAVFRGHTEIAGLLIAKGANVNEKYTGGVTPLSLAMILGHTEIVRLLIDSNADINVRNSAGETVQQVAEKWHRPAMAQMLKEASELQRRRAVEAEVHALAVQRQQRLKALAPHITIRRGPQP